MICANTFHFCLLWFVICASADNIFCPCPSIEKNVICDLCQHISFLFIVICSWCRSEFIMQAASWGSSARTSKRRWGTTTIMWWFGCFCFGSQFCCSESLSLLNMQTVSWGTKCSSPGVTKRIMPRYVCPALNFVNLLLFLLLQTSYVNSSLFLCTHSVMFNCTVSRLHIHELDSVFIYIYSIIALTTCSICTIWNMQFSCSCFVIFEDHNHCAFFHREHLIMCE